MGLLDKLRSLKGSAVGAVVDSASGAVEKIAGAATASREQREGNVAERDKAVQESYRAEYVKENRTWFDIGMDAINRLPRPAMAFGVIALFTIFTVNPAQGALIAEAWAKMPTEMIWLLGAVVTFYFGGRALDKRKK